MTLVDLLIPIGVASVALFFYSFLSWTVLPFHSSDWSDLENDDALRASVRGLKLAPGVYLFPRAKNHAAAKTPEFQAKYAEGPFGILTIMGPVNMGRNLLLTFLVFACATVLIAYLGSVTLPRGASFGKVMQTMATAGILTYCFSFLTNGIWFGGRGRAMLACLIDSLVFGLLTGLSFALLWPK